MKSVVSLLLCLILLSVVYQTQSFASGINAVVASLSDYQTENGGFKITRDQEPSLEATAQALFLSSLFGLRDKIDTVKAENFIQSLTNQDHGYSNQPGQPSDLESVRNALLSFSHIGGNHSQADRLGTFIESLYDRDTKLYANTFSGTGTIKSTAIAYQCLSILNLLQSNGVAEKSAAIKETFSGLVKSDTKSKYFSSITADNYYAIVVSHFVGLDLGDSEPWIRYFLDRQVKDGSQSGGFYSDNTKSDVTPEDAHYALSALSYLSSGPSGILPTDRIDLNSLSLYITNLPRSLRAAYAGFSAISRTSALQKTTFKTVPVYELTPPAPRPAPPANVIVQGASVKPSLSVRTFFGLPHAGLDVTLIVTHSRTGEKSPGKLKFNGETQTYTSDLDYKAEELGEVSFEFVMKWLVADLGSDLTMVVKEKKVIGYDLLIKSKAILGKGSSQVIPVGGDVAIGTEFDFEVQLGTVKAPKPQLKKGNFDVVFSVLDSSAVVIFKSTFDARENSEPITFKYTLSKTNLPEGELIFRFQVGNVETGYFSVGSVSYTLPLTMVATNIKFSGFNENTPPVYKIGDTVEVTMQPGSLPDLRTVDFYPSKDYQKKDVERTFIMDVSSSETQAVLFSLVGTPEVKSDGFLSYSFLLPVEATFNGIGTNTISFHYETASKKRIILKNYDLKSLGFFEDVKFLTYTVNTELHITNVKGEIKDGKLDYGNEVKFSFQVKDVISGKLVFAGSLQSTAYLVLKHTDEKRNLQYTSSKQAAVQTIDKQTSQPNNFLINWSVNPNAVKGKGTLQLVVQGPDGKEISLFEENSKNPWKVNVEIGGSIQISDKKFTDILDDEETVFLVEFDLSCDGKQLNDARLLATVSYKSSKNNLESFTIPVSHSKQPGRYQISWNLATDQIKSGDYNIQFFREVDLKRNAESEPLFSVKLYYGGASTKSPIKLDVVALVSFASAFFWLVYQRMEIEGTRNKQKKKTK